MPTEDATTIEGMASIPALRELRRIREMEKRVERATLERRPVLIAEAHAQGVKWDEIAEAAGMSPYGAQKAMKRGPVFKEAEGRATDDATLES